MNILLEEMILKDMIEERNVGNTVENKYE